MSTRSYICVEQNDGTYMGVYCHSDGYETYNGAMLTDHYNSKELAEGIIRRGCLSCLAPKLDPDPSLPHSFEFDKRQEGICVFYGRDRSEAGQEARVVKLEDIDKDTWIEYCYIFTKENDWKYFENGKLNEGLIRVEDGLKKIYEEYGFPRPKDYYGFFMPETINKLREEYQVAKTERQSAQEDMERDFITAERDMYAIYQLKKDDNLHYHRFSPYERLLAEGNAVERDNYDLIYIAPLSEKTRSKAYIHDLISTIPKTLKAIAYQSATLLRLTKTGILRRIMLTVSASLKFRNLCNPLRKSRKRKILWKCEVLI